MSSVGKRAGMARRWIATWPNVPGWVQWMCSPWVHRVGCMDMDPPPSPQSSLSVLGPGINWRCWRTCRSIGVALPAFRDKGSVYSRPTDSCPSATCIYKMLVKLLTVGAVEEKPREKLTLLNLVVLSSQPWLCFSSIY